MQRARDAGASARPTDIGLVGNLLLGTYDRQVARGVLRYAEQKPGWRIHMETELSPTPARGHLARYKGVVARQWQSLPVRSLDHLDGWKGDGLVATIDHPALLRLVRKMRVPVVEVSHTLNDTGLPVVAVDGAAIGRMAAEHLIERGMRHFAFYGCTYAWSLDRLRGFADSVSRAGGSLRKFVSAAMGTRTRLPGWLERLPKPVGIMACSDPWALTLANVCRHMGVAVPDEAAIVGVDDDDLRCAIAQPNLTSIVLPTFEVGYEAARLLDAMLRGAPAPAAPIFIPPVNITIRSSTDVMHARDDVVARALALIRTEAQQRMRVSAIARSLGVNRRTLERKFLEHLGVSPLHAIHRVRIDHATILLAASNLTIEEIAEKVGFTTARQFYNVFADARGMTPGEYRTRLRQR